MNVNRYTNNNRFPRSPNQNARWRNVPSFSFGYRRNELNEHSSPNTVENEELDELARHSPTSGTVSSQEASAHSNSRGHSQRGRVRNEASRLTRFQENQLTSVRQEEPVERDMELRKYMSDHLKAAFDTDFRIQLPGGSQEQWGSQLKNPYRNVSEAPQVPNRSPPLLANSHNPWQHSDTFRPNEGQYSFTQIGKREQSCASVALNGQQEQSAFREIGMKNVQWNRAPQTTPGQLFVAEPENKQGQERDWHPPSGGFNQSNSRGYFEKLKQQEHQKKMFGNQEAFQSNVQAMPPRSMEGSRTSSFGNCKEELSFSTFVGARGASSQSKNIQVQENPTAVSSNFQGTWRDKNKGNHKTRNNFRKPGKQYNRGNRGRPNMHNFKGLRQVENTPYERNWSSQVQMNPKAVSIPEEQQWEDANSPRGQKLQDQPNQRPLDARVILERKRKCAIEEALGSQPQLESSIKNERALAQPSLPQQHLGKFSEDLDQKRIRVQNPEGPRKNTQQGQHWTENYISESVPFKAVVPEVHEVDESKLLPADVPLGQLQHVVFLDIDKRSFFDEVKQAFLPGTLVYLFLGDPSLMLPTREHPFYKENKNNWVYFYPDCGTEYGCYLVAAPAVIDWMNQQLPQRVKFLVHGHQKQLKLEGLQRKVTFYPTSRTIDVQLLNRMLNGDFEPPQATRTGVPAGKTVVIRKNPKPLLPNPPSTSLVGYSLAQKSTLAPPSVRQRIQPVVAPKNASRRIPIVPPGQTAKPDVPPPRKKIVW